MSEVTIDTALEVAGEALRRGELEAAQVALAPLAARRKSDARVAAAVLRLLRQSPGRPDLVAAVTEILDAFPADAGLVTLGCDALIREAERLAPDEPPPANGAAHTAVRLVQRCLEGLPAADRDDAGRMGYLQIGLANALRLAHLHDRAGAAYRAALKRGPEHGYWWFNYGLLHKARGAFDEGLEANEEARARLGNVRPVLWNIAICATALGQGKRAVEAYRELGIPCGMNAAGMPQADGLPPAQIRVATVGAGHAGPAPVPDQAVSFELLWVLPLSPCHGVVQTPTYRQASADYGDLVLWDAIPVGTGSRDGQPVPRFPLLSVLRRGDEHRFRFVALERAPGAIGGLEGELDLGEGARGGQLFVHRPRGTPERELVYGKVVLPAATELSTFRDAFFARVRAQGDLELVMPELFEALGETAAAGKAHTMWAGLERTVEKRRKP